MHANTQDKSVMFDEGRQKVTSSLQEMGSLWAEFVRMKGADSAVSNEKIDRAILAMNLLIEVSYIVSCYCRMKS